MVRVGVLSFTLIHSLPRMLMGGIPRLVTTLVVSKSLVDLHKTTRSIALFL